MNYTSLAFFMGLFGSLHCVAMCGPLVMALPVGGSSWWYNLMQRFLYQFGRICTYSVFGLFFGFIGNGFNILGLQQVLSLVTGAILITLALVHFSGNKITRFSNFQVKMVAPIATLMGRWLSKPYGGLFAGTLHGLLPCGMVYMAIAASLNAGSPIEGSKFMFFFGLGTTPLLVLASVIPLFLRKFKVPALLIPALFLVAGAFLVTRGMNMNIPYISSPVLPDQTINCE